MIEELILETIKKRGNKYCLVAGSGRNLGCYKSKKGAAKREKQVNYFKHIKKEESGVAAVAGYSAPIGSKRGKKMNKIGMLREHIKTVLRTEKRKQRAELKERNFLEYKLRKTIRKILKEADDIISHESTGINVLADLLETIVPILKSYYKKLGTDIEQRKSFRAHIIKGVQNLLSPVALMFKAGGYAGKSEEAPVTPEAPSDDMAAGTAPDAGGEEEQLDEEDKVDVKISAAEKDPQFIPLKADRKEKEEASKEQEKEAEPAPEAAFQPIQGEDETGRNIALQSFKRVEKQIREAYSLLANEEDRNLFYDYLITNLKLYFDKFEDELQITVPEPTTSAYEQEKSRKEQEASGQGGMGTPEAEPTGGEELEQPEAV